MDDIRCLCLDVDGVLTDGRIYYDSDGRDMRGFNTQDGLAIDVFRKSGGEVVIISGKKGRSSEQRAADLHIRHCVVGSPDKLADLTRILAELSLRLEQVAAIGDDLPDLGVLRACGFPIAVANAVVEVKAAARYVTHRPGGHGAVREAVEMLLRRDGRWHAVVQRFTMSSADVRG
ncbi:3-deoxy-D-manno-octulosonate 8-phosphate phosphatase KdsC [Phycisphaerae bacterium RAS1]|nr:3-deoxy-D-manno-octulosonate 8-phosphate phosphatase KdsC [Phycisphaerae bacterium RAS1]